MTTHRTVTQVANRIYFDSHLKGTTRKDAIDLKKFFAVLAEAGGGSYHDLHVECSHVHGVTFQPKVGEYLYELGIVDIEASVKGSHKDMLAHVFRLYDYIGDEEEMEEQAINLQKDADMFWQHFEASVVPVELVAGKFRAVVPNDLMLINAEGEQVPAFPEVEPKAEPQVDFDDDF